MNDQETENFLKESGMSAEEIEKLKPQNTEQTQENSEQTTQSTTEQQTEAVTTETTTEKPNEQAATNEEKFWDDDDILSGTEKPKPTETEVKEITDDFKAKYEEVHGKLTKIESNQLLKKLLEVIDAPEFDYEKFIESQITRKIDYASLPLENLFKAKLESDKIAGYTEQEIEDMWEEKRLELKDNPTAQKTLKSELAREFQGREEVQLDEEPELIKEWKQSKQQRLDEIKKDQQEFKELNDGISEYSKSLIGKKMGGIEITAEIVAEIPKRLGLSSYMDAKGKLDPQKITNDQLKAVMFDKVVENLKKTAVAEALKKVTRPNASGGGNAAIETDGRDENKKILDTVAQSMGLKDSSEFTK